MQSQLPFTEIQVTLQFSLEELLLNKSSTHKSSYQAPLASYSKIRLLNNPQLHRRTPPRILLPSPMNLRRPILQLDLLSIIRIANEPDVKVLVIPPQVITLPEHPRRATTRPENRVAVFLKPAVATMGLMRVGIHHVETAEVAAVFVVPGREGAGVGVDVDVGGFLGGVG